MANIIPVDNWSDIPQIEQTDKVLGGEGQIANQQAQALANRVENLKNTVTNNKTTQDNKNVSIDTAINDLSTNKVNKSDIVNNTTTTASGKVLDGRMGKTLNDTITSNYNTLNTNKVNKSDVVNNYTTTTSGKVLDARVAVSLKTLIDGKQPSGSYVLTSNVVNVLNTTVSGKVLDARAGKTLNDTITSNYNTLNTNKVNKSDIADNLTTNNASKVLSAKQGYVLKGLIDTANTNINTKINKTDIADNLTTDSSTKVLSAKQGKTLKGLIDTANTNITNLSNNKVNKSDIVNNTNTTASGKVLDGRMGKTLNDLITTANTNITNLSNNKVNKTDIADNLTTDSSTKVLSAKQGKILNEKIASNVPVGTILPYMGGTLPAGFLWCNGATGLSKTTYANLYAALGENFDYTATTFQLPNLRLRFLEGNSTMGENPGKGLFKEAGLPNIKGTFSPASVERSGTTKSGAFLNSTKTQIYGHTGEGYSDAWNIDFDASVYNSIYGKSTTVQPKAVSCNFIIKY